MCCHEYWYHFVFFKPNYFKGLKGNNNAQEQATKKVPVLSL